MSIDATLRVEVHSDFVNTPFWSSDVIHKLTLSAGSTPVKLLGCSQVIRETKYTRVTRFVRTTSGPLEQIRLHIPKCFVVKTYHLTGELDTEWSAYNRLKAVQGKVVPKIYGLVGTRTEGNQAIAMEFLDVQDSAETVTGRSELHNVRSALKYCYQKLAECGVCQCDPKTDAVRIVRLHGQMYMRWLLRATFLRASENIIVAQSRTALPVCFLVLDAALAIGAFLFHSAMHFWILFIIGVSIFQISLRLY